MSTSHPRFISILGILLIAFGAISLLLPLLPGLFFILAGVSVLSPRARKEMMDWKDRLFARYRRP